MAFQGRYLIHSAVRTHTRNRTCTPTHTRKGSGRIRGHQILPCALSPHYFLFPFPCSPPNLSLLPSLLPSPANLHLFAHLQLFFPTPAALPQEQYGPVTLWLLLGQSQLPWGHYQAEFVGTECPLSHLPTGNMTGEGNGTFSRTVVATTATLEPSRVNSYSAILS